jgi:transcriptional regulator with XRE-family HTH domain
MAENFGQLLRKYRRERGFSQWELYGELAERGLGYTGVRSGSIISRWESGKRKPPSYETILALEQILQVPDGLLASAAGYPPTKGRQKDDFSASLKEWANQVADLAQDAESRAASFVGQGLATQLDALAPRVFRSLGCYDIGLKAVSDTLHLLGQRFEASLEALRDVQSSLERRKTLREQILINAKHGCEAFGSVELIDNNFTLAAYHFFARGDKAWLDDDHFQVLKLAAVGPPSRGVECPRCTHQISLQEWDTRKFVCPEHEVPLVESLPIPLPKPPMNPTSLYEESVVPIEYIALEYSSKETLSLRIPKMLPFSEIVIAAGDTASITSLVRFVQELLYASSALRKEVHINEEHLKDRYAELLQALRSTPVAEP